MSTPDDSLGSFYVHSPVALGQAVRTFRRARGLTQQQLADAAGINRGYLVALENGHVTEQVMRIVTLLRVLGVEIVLQDAEA